MNVRVRHIVNLPATLSRRAQDLVDAATSPYVDLTDLVTVAVRNQLELDEEGDDLELRERLPGYRGSGGRNPVVNDLGHLQMGFTALRRPTRQDIHTAESSGPVEELTFLTNRANPFHPVVRVAANLGPSTVEAFIEGVAEHLRPLGLELRDDDVRRGLPMAHRRATSYPVGKKIESSIEKFTASYVLDEEGRGPAVNLGLLALTESGLVACTPIGADLAASIHPFLDGPDDGTALSSEAVDILREAIFGNHAEASVVAQFVKALEAADGIQTEVDAHLGVTHPSWSSGQVTAHRAALVGRLRDLRVVGVDGRGSEAVLKLLPTAADFLQRLEEALGGTQ